MISIGNVLNGIELKETPLGRSLRDVSRLISEIRGPLQLGVVPLVNVVFLVPGSMGGPTFEGAKVGQYSKKDRAVVVQIAVPSSQVAAEKPERFVINSLHEATKMAFSFFRKKGEQFAQHDAEILIDKVALRLGAALGK